MKSWILPVALLMQLALALPAFAEPADQISAPSSTGEEPRSGASESGRSASRAEEGGSMTATDEARRSYREGSDLVEKGQWASAIVAYRKSFELHAASSTLANLAYCENHLGHLVEAWLLLVQALSLSDEGGGAPLVPERRARIEGERERIKDRIASITVAGGDGAELRVDGARIVPIAGMPLAYRLTESDRENWQRLPSGGQIFVDPAQYQLHHRLQAAIQSQTIKLGEGESVTFLAGSAGPAPGPHPRVTSPPREASSATIPLRITPIAARPGGDHPFRAPAIASLILSGVAFTSAAISLGVMLDAESKLSEACSVDHVCPEDQAGTVSQYKAAAVMTDVSVIAGVGTAALGVSLFILDGARSQKQIAFRAKPWALGVQAKF